MATMKQLVEWKETFHSIYEVTIQEQPFIFRALGREEYKQIVFLDLDLGEFQETLCQKAMLEPVDYPFHQGIAGVAEVLSDAILDASGLHLNQAMQLVTGYRQEMFLYDYQVDCLIHEAFPEFTLEQISAWDVRRTMYYLSRAEWILETLRGVPLSQMYYMPTELEQPGEPVDSTDPISETEETPPEGAIQTEEEVLAMLAAAGGQVSKPIASLDNTLTPELSWFGYMDELKGEFD